MPKASCYGYAAKITTSSHEPVAKTKEHLQRKITGVYL